MDEEYLSKYQRNEIIQIYVQEFSDFQNKLLKKHWFLNENFVLGSNFLRFDRFVHKKVGK